MAGFLLGLIFIFNFVLLFFINPLFIQYFWINFLLSVFFSWLFVHWLVLKFRRKNGGLSGYGDVLKISFVTMMTALLFFFVFQLLFYNFMVPDYFGTYKDQLLKLDLENSRMFYKFLGKDDIYLEQLYLEQMEEYDDRKQNEFKSWSGAVILVFEGLINSLLFALIISLFYRKLK